MPHVCLLLKLESLGVSGKLLWLRGFLTKRYQQVVINGSFSEWALVTSGVPQSSVSRPLLFLLYVNDLAEEPSTRMFADDVLLISQLTWWLTVGYCRMAYNASFPGLRNDNCI